MNTSSISCPPPNERRVGWGSHCREGSGEEWASPPSYLYDPLGNRVRQTVGSIVSDYIVDQAGRTISQMNPALSRSELYAGGVHVATYANGTTYFDHSDLLGTLRARSSVAGASVETCTSLPFGDAQTCTGTDRSPLHFTGKELDTESNLHHFLFRQLSTTQGRWTAPDPASAGATDPTNPQTWNQYAYVANLPVSALDDLGLRIGRSEVYYSPRGYGYDPFSLFPDASMTDDSIPTETLFETTSVQSDIIYDPSDPIDSTLSGSSDLSLYSETFQRPDLASGGSMPILSGFTEAQTVVINRSKEGARQRLQQATCASFFRGRGAARLNSTTYRPESLANTTIQARTFGPTRVKINTNGDFFRAEPGTVFFTNLRIGGISQEGMRQAVLLHELSHQLNIAVYDAGRTPARQGANFYNTLRILTACGFGGNGE
jgi:RHS repeat-associated protein